MAAAVAPRWLRLLILAFILALARATSPAAASTVDLYVFWGEGCPHCEEQKPFLRALAARYPALTIHSHEVWTATGDRTLFSTLARFHGIEASAVPTVFVGGRAFVGDSPDIRHGIEEAIRAVLADQPETGPVEPAPQLTLPFLGTVDLAGQPLALTTLLVGFVDGVNPCSLWVLTLLLGMVVHSGSRGRVTLIGLTFLATTALLYGAFVAGLFGAMSIVGHLTWIRWLVACLAILIGLIDLKDFLWFRRGLSLTIAERYKPGLYARMRSVMDPQRSGPMLVAATVTLAAGAALVELPCTLGFPIVWNGVLAEAQVSGPTYAALLALYLLIYLVDELVIFALAVATLRLRRFEEGHGRALKLLAGTIMIALGLAMAIRPTLMNDIGRTLLVFAAALAAAGTIAFLDRLRRGSGTDQA